MSTLTALKLARELDINRLAIVRRAGKPMLEMRWLLDPESGKPVTVWATVQQATTATAQPVPAFA